MNGLTLPAEARIADVARTMIRSGDWVVPRFGGQLRLKKPPLAYWLTALCNLPRGRVDAWGARLPGVLAAAGALMLVYLIAASEFSHGAGIWAMLILGTTHAFIYYARLATIEMPLLCCNLLGVLAWIRGRAPAADRRGSAGWMLGFYACLGLGILLKGPVGPLTVLLILGARRLGGQGEAGGRAWPWAWHAAGVALCIGLTVPWVWALVALEPRVVETWWRESMGRFAGVDHLHGFWYYLVVVPLDSMPWSPLLIPAVLHLRRDRELRARSLWLVAWFGVCLVFFSIPASKKHSYVLPLYPAMAMLCGVFIDYLLTRLSREIAPGAGKHAAVAGPARKIFYCYSISWVAAAVGIHLWAGAHPGIYAAPAWFASARLGGEILLTLCGVVGLLLAARGRIRASLLVSCAAAFICLGLVRTSLPWYWRGRAVERAVREFSPGLREYRGVIHTAGIPYLEHEILVFYLDRPMRKLSTRKQERVFDTEIMVAGEPSAISRELDLAGGMLIPVVREGRLPRAINWNLFRLRPRNEDLPRPLPPGNLKNH